MNSGLSGSPCGLIFYLAGGVTGYSHSQMSRDGLDMLANYSLGFEVDVRVIYITPILNTVILTLRDFRLSDVVGELVALSPGRLWAWPELQSGVGEFIEIYTLYYYCNKH